MVLPWGAIVEVLTDIGLEVLPQVPIAEKNQFAAVVTIRQKIKRLTGYQLQLAEWGASHARSA